MTDDVAGTGLRWQVVGDPSRDNDAEDRIWDFLRAVAMTGKLDLAIVGVEALIHVTGAAGGYAHVERQLAERGYRLWIHATGLVPVPGLPGAFEGPVSYTVRGSEADAVAIRREAGVLDPAENLRRLATSAPLGARTLAAGTPQRQMFDGLLAGCVRLVPSRMGRRISLDEAEEANLAVGVPVRRSVP